MHYAEEKNSQFEININQKFGNRMTLKKCKLICKYLNK